MTVKLHESKGILHYWLTVKPPTIVVVSRLLTFMCFDTYNTDIVVFQSEYLGITISYKLYDTVIP